MRFRTSSITDVDMNVNERLVLLLVSGAAIIHISHVKKTTATRAIKKVVENHQATSRSIPRENRDVRTGRREKKTRQGATESNVWRQ